MAVLEKAASHAMCQDKPAAGAADWRAGGRGGVRPFAKDHAQLQCGRGRVHPRVGRELVRLGLRFLPTKVEAFFFFSPIREMCRHKQKVEMDEWNKIRQLEQELRQRKQAKEAAEAAVAK